MKDHRKIDSSRTPGRPAFLNKTSTSGRWEFPNQASSRIGSSIIAFNVPRYLAAIAPSMTR